MNAQELTIRSAQYVWADCFPAGDELYDALNEEVTWGDTAMVLIEPAIAISALDQWLDDARLDLDPEEFTQASERVLQTISLLKGLGEDVYLAIS